MGVSQWWLYDLVVIAVAVLCIWNGLSGGLLKSCGSLVVGVVSCIVAGWLSGSISEVVYDSFLKQSVQSTISEKLSEVDVTDNIRSELENNGIYLSLDDEQIADIIDGVRSEDSAMQQAAAMFGINTDEIDEKLEEAVNYAIETHGDIIPDWAEKTVSNGNGKIKIDSAADAAVAILRDDYTRASAEIENAYVRPAVISLLRTIVFICLAALLSSILRTVLLVLPSKKNSTMGTVVGAAFGAAKAALYLYLLVLLVRCISSMQSGDYPFYSDKTINQTYLFRIFYDMWK